MVGCYRTSHGGTQGLDSFNCCTRRGMLEDYTKPWEVGMEFPQVGQKGWLSVYYMDVLYQVQRGRH
jgi:hypothetical protein